MSIERREPSEADSPFRVPERLFAASIWGNEKMPQKYFTIISEILSEMLNAPEWEQMADGYFASALSESQSERLAKAATKSHKLYGIVDYRGDVIQATPRSAEGLWNTERSRALSLLCQVGLIAGGRAPGMQLTPKALEDDQQNFERVLGDTMRALREVPGLRARLGRVFGALQSVIESAEMSSQFDVYKALITNRKAIAQVPVDAETGEGPMTHWKYGVYLREEIIRRARRIASGPEEQKILDLVDTYATGLML